MSMCYHIDVRVWLLGVSPLPLCLLLQNLRKDFHHFDHPINPAMPITDGHSFLSMWDRMDHGFGVAVAPQDTLDLQTPQSSGEFGWGGAFSTMCAPLGSSQLLL
eukprot:COSAG06_NODE_753_length_12547_cov_928.116244_9_plen_104_part_00